MTLPPTWRPERAVGAVAPGSSCQDEDESLRAQSTGALSR